MVISTRLEYAIYYLALKEPEILDDIKNFNPSMLANDQSAALTAKSLSSKLALEHIEVTNRQW